jgi:hypothetical protein
VPPIVIAYLTRDILRDEHATTQTTLVSGGDRIAPYKLGHPVLLKLL